VAVYRVIQWRDIPSLVEAVDGDEVVRIPLSQRFQDLIDAVAMREGASEADAYLEGWGHSEDLERPGGAKEVAERVAALLEGEFQNLIAKRVRPPPPS
jgi:hypothetical protein